MPEKSFGNTANTCFGPPRHSFAATLRVEPPVARGTNMNAHSEAREMPLSPVATPVPTPAVAFEDVSLTFANGTHALSQISLSVRKGEFVSLLGPSGSGKSTLLRLVAGLERPTSGRVQTNGESLGYVFQDATLLPWRSVLGNVELPLHVAGVSLEQRQARARRAIERVGLSGFEQHKPAQLSGGMRMRTSIARMLTMEPQIFLFDEPFGALDDMTRESLNEQVVNMFSAEPFAGLFVTHSVRESVFLSTRVVVLSPRPGRIAADIPIPFAFPRSVALSYTSEFTDVIAQVARALREAAR